MCVATTCWVFVVAVFVVVFFVFVCFWGGFLFCFVCLFFKHMLNLFRTINSHEKELYLSDFIKHAVNIGLRQDICESIFQIWHDAKLDKTLQCGSRLTGSLKVTGSRGKKNQNLRILL